MQRMTLAVLPLAIFLAGCEGAQDGTEVERALSSLNVVDETNLNDVMLSSADPGEAVDYFARSLSEEPERIDLQRGLATSLIRASRHEEAIIAWQVVTKHEKATNEDGVNLADAYIRNGEWSEAKVALDAVPPTYETYRRYRLEAMVADSNREWDRADSFYETAVGLTTKPANVLNNWGYSKLTRGDFDGAERLFIDAIKQDGDLFTAKNNLVLARGAQRKYDLPIMSMSQVERAQLLHTLGLSAIKQGDVSTGRGLLRQAIDTHPQYFEAAVRSLNALEGTVVE